MDPLSVAASGVRSAELRFAASAHNVANLVTPDFRPLRAEQAAMAGDGSRAYVSQEPVARGVDLVREILEQSLAALQLRASARVFATASSLRGELVDLLA